MVALNALFVPAIAVATFAVVGRVLAPMVSPHVSRAGMRFFRDLGRIRSRRRRMTAGAHNSLMVLFGREQEILSGELSENEVVVDIEELRWADGKLQNDEGGSHRKPLWLSLRGRVYDVSAGEKFYGDGGPYNIFIGKDATRAFCTGCLEEECLIASTDGLSSEQIREADRWVEYYEFHDKYSYVGKLEDTTGNIDALVELALETEAVGDYNPPKVPNDDLSNQVPNERRISSFNHPNLEASP